MQAIDIHAHFGVHDRGAGGLAVNLFDNAARLLGAKTAGIRSQETVSP